MPSLLLDIGASVARLERDVKKAHTTLDGFSKSITSAWKLAAGAIAGIGVQRAIRDVTSAYIEQENAINKMTVALKNQGIYTEQTLRDAEDFSAAMQKMTTVGDELTLSLMANLTTYGIQGEELKKATKLALDFASAKKEEGLSVTTAAELIGKAYVGQTQTLTRYGIVLKEGIKSGDKFNAVLEQLEGRFGGAAQAELNTYSGQWKQLANEWGDFKEAVGEMVLAIGSALLPILRSVVSKTQEAAEGMKIFFGVGERAALQKEIHNTITAIEDVERKIREQKENQTGIAWMDNMFGSVDDLIERRQQLLALLEDLTIKLNKPRDTSGVGKQNAPSDIMGGLDKDALAERKKQMEAIAELTKQQYELQYELLSAGNAAELEAWQDKEDEKNRIETENIEYRMELRSIAIERAKEEAEEEKRIAKEVAEHNMQVKEYEERSKSQISQNYLQAGMNIMAAIRGATGKESKIIFGIAKALEVAKATMAAFSASAMALASPPGPPFTIPLSKSVLAMGLANAAAIAATAFGQMSAGGGGGGGGLGSIPTGQAAGSTIPSAAADINGEGGRAHTLEINIHGDFIGDEAYIEMLANKISEAVEDKDVRLIATDARFAAELR